jgi:hypothetical protein
MKETLGIGNWEEELLLHTQYPMTAVAPLGETPSPLASPLLPKGEANAKGEDRTASPMPIID